MRILCIEDNEDTRELLTTMLGLSDLEAVAVPAAAEALRLMEGEQFSLYIIDGQLPDVGGLSFCEEIRRVDKTTPVVFFTGKALEADREAALLAGANAYVVKPDADGQPACAQAGVVPTPQTVDKTTKPKARAKKSDGKLRRGIQTPSEYQLQTGACRRNHYCVRGNAPYQGK